MKRVLVISPHFPPANAADMQRIRMSLPYFKENNWDVEVVMVNELYIDTSKDIYLLDNLHKEVIIHKVRAFPKKITSKFGLGSLALRSIYFYKKYVNILLKTKTYDLIYFSTTEFSITILGAYWKKKYSIPYVIDMQDPWHNDYYEDKPKAERPKKYWFSYRLNKYLEPISMKRVGGLVSVSQAYLDTLVERYPHLNKIAKAVITFGAFKPDFDFVNANSNLFGVPYQKEEGSFNFVYVGRGGHDMKQAITLLFEAFNLGLTKNPAIFDKIRFHFIGTSYAPAGQGIATIKPMAEMMGLAKYVNEQTNRISFYNSIYTLQTADALLILGSDDPQYTASKIYPYILAERPLLAFFHPESSASKIIKNCNAGKVISLIEDKNQTIENVYSGLIELVNGKVNQNTNWKAFEPYNALNMTKNQVLLFNEVITSFK